MQSDLDEAVRRANDYVQTLWTSSEAEPPAAAADAPAAEEAPKPADAPAEEAPKPAE